MGDKEKKGTKPRHAPCPMLFALRPAPFALRQVGTMDGSFG